MGGDRYYTGKENEGGKSENDEDEDDRSTFYFSSPNQPSLRNDWTTSPDLTARTLL
jgi:hypothetical protein